jgi:predicted flavoprotein YhiN
MMSVFPPEVTPLADLSATQMSPGARLGSAFVVGGGPAGLMAAQTLAGAGLQVDLFDAMASVGRKFLLAGKGGLNLTHSEPLPLFTSRYGHAAVALGPQLAAWGPEQVRDWARGLGVDTFVGSSGRVFPVDLKAAPLLRAWLHRLRQMGVRFHMRQRWTGWTPDGRLAFSAQGTRSASSVDKADVVVLALGGGSWARLGSDGAWVGLLEQRGIPVHPLRPSNCGFDVAVAKSPSVPPEHQHAGATPVASLASPGWSPYFRDRFAGQPFKSVAISFTDSQQQVFWRKGEFVATATGVEGSLVYSVSALLRDDIARNGSAVFHLDLLPDKSPEHVLAEVTHPRGSRSLGSHLKSRLGLDGIKSAVLHELSTRDVLADPVRLAAAIKALAVRVVAARLDANAMLVGHPGLFCAGEMLDWEAPTGGYLLTGCLASGRAAGQGAVRYLQAVGLEPGAARPGFTDDVLQ